VRQNSVNNNNALAHLHFMRLLAEGKIKQMTIIKKETIIQTCGACPSQWDAKTTDGDKVYIRVRHGYFRLEVNDVNIFDGEPDDVDGVMSTDEMIDYVNKNNEGRIMIV
jgi:biotin synthase-related radical SAM superfamily protein